jgi:hypothetical protein
MPTPLYCPACGTRLPEGDEFAMPIEVPTFLPTSSGGTLRVTRAAFDVWCPACEWSGDIEPDEKTKEAE